MQCYSLDTCEGRARLYLSETSTSAALRLLSSEEPLVVIEFGAVRQPSGQWCSVADLPPLSTAGALATFLEAHESLAPVDVTVRIGAEIELSTHDDGEATLTVSSDLHALQLLGRAVSHQDLPLLTAALQSHRGQYVVLGDDGVRVFSTFEDYLHGV